MKKWLGTAVLLVTLGSLACCTGGAGSLALPEAGAPVTHYRLRQPAPTDQPLVAHDALPVGDVFPDVQPTTDTVLGQDAQPPIDSRADAIFPDVKPEADVVPADVRPDTTRADAVFPDVQTSWVCPQNPPLGCVMLQDCYVQWQGHGCEGPCIDANGKPIISQPCVDTRLPKLVVGDCSQCATYTLPAGVSL